MNKKLSVLASEAGMFTRTEDDRLFCLFGGMFYAAPALLHELVNKYQDEKYKIHPKINELLEKHNLIVDQAIPPNIKKYIASHFKITKDGISMTM